MIVELLLNFGGAWFITKHINRWLYLIPALLTLAFFSALTRELIDFYFQPEQVSAGKSLLTAISITPINFLVCVLFAIFFKRRKRQ